MNVIYKLLAELTHCDNIEFGKKIALEVDLALAHDGSMPSIIAEANKVEAMGGFPYGNKLNVTIDHFLPCPSTDARESFFKIKEFCDNNKIKLFSKGEGILHQVVAENLDEKLKDKVVVGVDGHICTSAALGALPFSISAKRHGDGINHGKILFSRT